MTKRDTLNLTLDERHKFESLLAEYANAEMDVVRATGRRHNALWAVNDYVNNRTNQLATEAYHEGIASVVVIQTHDERTVEVPTGTTRPFTSAELEGGAIHYKHDAPVDCCQCGACCTARALASIGTPSETQFGPPPGQYSGN